jgi:hypothetical protein
MKKFKIKNNVTSQIMDIVCVSQKSGNNSSIYGFAKTRISNSVERSRHNSIWITIRSYIDAVGTATCDMIYVDIHSKDKKK